MAITVLDILTPVRPWVFADAPDATAHEADVTGSDGTAHTLRGSPAVADRTDIRLFRGERAVITATLYGSDGAAEDVTGWALSFVVRPRVREGNEAVITKTVGHGVTLTTPASGVVTVETDADDNDLAPGVYDYTLARTDSGSEVVYAYGAYVILRNTVLGTQTEG